MQTGPWAPLGSISLPLAPHLGHLRSLQSDYKKVGIALSFSLLPLGGLAAQSPPALAIKDGIMEKGKEGEIKGTNGSRLTPRPFPVIYMYHLLPASTSVTLSWAHHLLG